MSALRKAIEQYLTLRHHLGFELHEPARILRKFVAFAERQGASHVTTDLVLRWVQEPSKAQPSTQAAAVAVVRRFAAWRRPADPKTEIPPPDLLVHRYHRQRPYVYSLDEIQRIVLTTAQLESPKGLRALTYSTLFGLLATTGLRISEGVALDRTDVDLREGILTIRRSKFGKSRVVPVHSSTQRALRQYCRARDLLQRPMATPAFFLSERGTRITGWRARHNFVLVSAQIGLRKPFVGHRYGHGPRLHDLRHSFAVRTLIDWYRLGCDVEREIPKLATYLGHVHLNDTYWYLEAVPELLHLASKRLMHPVRAVNP